MEWERRFIRQLSSCHDSAGSLSLFFLKEKKRLPFSSCEVAKRDFWTSRPRTRRDSSPRSHLSKQLMCIWHDRSERACLFMQERAAGKLPAVTMILPGCDLCLRLTKMLQRFQNFRGAFTQRHSLSHNPASKKACGRQRGIRRKYGLLYVTHLFRLASFFWELDLWLLWM